jgi:hypothetical protein
MKMTDAEIDQLGAHLVSKHVSYCISIGRDPADYASQWSRYADALAAVRGERDRMREALHGISLCSQNSASSKDECGRIARQALGDTE